MKNEEIYDKWIAPKLLEIAETCKKYKIPFLAIAEYEIGKICRTELQTNDECLQMVMIRHCARTAPNIDGYLIGFIRWAREHNINMDSSIFLRQWLKENNEKDMV